MVFKTQATALGALEGLQVRREHRPCYGGMQKVPFEVRREENCPGSQLMMGLPGGKLHRMLSCIKKTSYHLTDVPAISPGR